MAESFLDSEESLMALKIAIFFNIFEHQTPTPNEFFSIL